MKGLKGHSGTNGIEHDRLMMVTRWQQPIKIRSILDISCCDSCRLKKTSDPSYLTSYQLLYLFGSSTCEELFLHFP